MYILKKIFLFVFYLKKNLIMINIILLLKSKSLNMEINLQLLIFWKKHEQQVKRCQKHVEKKTIHFWLFSVCFVILYFLL